MEHGPPAGASALATSRQPSDLQRGVITSIKHKRTVSVLTPNLVLAVTTYRAADGSVLIPVCGHNETYTHPLFAQKQRPRHNRLIY
jgi:hypothetical protein